MVRLNLFPKITTGFLLFFLSFFFGGVAFANAERDSLEKFYDDRFSLYPPTEQEQLAVVEALETFLERLRGRNVTEAYFLSTSREFQGTITFEGFKLFVQNLIGIDFEETLNKNAVSFNSNDKTKATYKLTLTGKKKQKYLIEFSLENQEGDWKIMNIKIYEVFRTR